MPFPLAAVIGGVGLAKSLLGKKPQPREGYASPFMGNDELERYLALRDIMRKVKSPYMASLYGRNTGGMNAGY